MDAIDVLPIGKFKWDNLEHSDISPYPVMGRRLLEECVGFTHIVGGVEVYLDSLF